MKKLHLKKQILYDILMLLFFCISGNPAFNDGSLGKWLNLVMIFILISAMHFRVKRNTYLPIFKWTVLVCVIFSAQFLKFGQITVLGSLNFIMKIWCAIMMAKLLGEKFPETALRVMSVICLISLVLYPFNLAGIRFPALVEIQSKSESLIFYTQTWEDIKHSGPYRNSGMFWEPGAFAGYIIFVFMLFIGNPASLWKKYKVRFLLLFIALITTLSTTGYIVASVLILYAILKTHRSKVLGIALAGLASAGIIYLFLNLDFLGEKIKNEFFFAESENEIGLNYSRIGSVIFDLQYIASSPIFGNGLDNSTRFRFHQGLPEEDLSGFSNGFSGCIASMGILYMIVYLVSVFRNPTLKSRWMLMLILILLLQGEYFLNYPAFMSLPFINFGSNVPPVDS